MSADPDRGSDPTPAAFAPPPGGPASLRPDRVGTPSKR